MVALKFLRADRVNRHSGREARALGRLDHPSIVRVNDVLFEFRVRDTSWASDENFDFCKSFIVQSVV